MPGEGDVNGTKVGSWNGTSVPAGLHALARNGGIGGAGSAGSGGNVNGRIPIMPGDDPLQAAAHGHDRFGGPGWVPVRLFLAHPLLEVQASKTSAVPVPAGR